MFRNKFVRFVLIPTILLILWIVSSLILTSYKSFTLLTYPHQLSEYVVFPNDGILSAGNKLTGELNARDNNLGIVSLKIEEVRWKGEEEVAQFRVKEKGSNKWYFVAEVKSAMISGNKMYPFGFSVLPDSKGKTYVFEFEVIRDFTDSEIIISRANPVFTSSYKFSASEISSPANFTDFLIKKLQTFITNRDAIIATSIFFIPFELYVLWLFISVSRVGITKKQNLIKIPIILIIVDILFFELQIPALYIPILMLYIFIFVKTKLGYRYNFFVVSAVFVIGFSLSLFGENKLADKASTWVYFLMVFGFYQLLKSNISNK